MDKKNNLFNLRLTTRELIELLTLAEEKGTRPSEFLRNYINYKYEQEKKENPDYITRFYKYIKDREGLDDTPQEIKSKRKKTAEQPSLIDHEETAIKEPIEKPSIERKMDTPSKEQKKTTEKMDNQNYINLFDNNQNPFTTEEIKERAIEYITMYGTPRQLNKIQEIKKIEMIQEEEKERIYNQIIKIENYSIKNHRGTENGIETLLGLFKNIKKTHKNTP